ncbi:MAG TPA: dihydrodipicolinate synthase family protein [Acidobacteriaceae bacterium]|nr:dihydrodipicolinate synthase family protein [Acidobacteriaceae bacterium]
MAISLKLVGSDGVEYNYTPSHEPLTSSRRGKFETRVAFAAAHVVVDPARTPDPITQPVIDWDRTIAYREHLWSLGFGVAEAMDTAQRGMGLDWPLALELIKRSTSAATACDSLVACGAGTDHLSTKQSVTLQDVTNAYLKQCDAIEGVGGRIILMASRALAAVARHAEDYALVYATVLSQVRQPVILHWLGPMFDPALDGYWGGTTISEAAGNCLNVIRAHKEKIDGIKISLLDAEFELSMRRQLPPNVRMYTGDDLNYDRLILGDEQGYSDALLGIFDAIAPAASLALSALDANDVPRYHELLAPTVPLSRLIFASPTQHYKTGVVFLAYLNGFQSHFRMIGGTESARSVMHLCELFVLADRARVLRDPELAVQRMRAYLQLAGVA